MRFSLLLAALVALALAPPADAQPINDDWHHGAFIISDGQVLTGSNADATADDDYAAQPSCDLGTTPDEPSVWYIVTPTGDGEVTFSTEGSTFDTILTIHNNGSPGEISDELACNDDAEGEPAGTRWSRITFAAGANEYYYVRVTGYNGATGNVTLTATGATITEPPNVQYGSYVLDTDPYYGTNVGVRTTDFFTDATCVTAGSDNQQSVLWFYEAQTTGDISISLEGSSFDTILTVYQDAAEIGCNDDSSPGIRWSRLDNISVTEGDSYFIRVSGFVDASAGEEGDIVLTLTADSPVANEGAEDARIALLPPSPNPAAGPVRLGATLAEAAEARVEVFDVLGRSVTVLHDGPLATGETAWTWDAVGQPAGLYVVRMTASGAVHTQTVSVVR